MIRFFSVVSVCFGLVGCQLLLSTDRMQCATDGDCSAKAGAGLVCRNAVCVASALTPAVDGGTSVDTTSPWGCLAEPPARTTEDRSQTVTYRQRFIVYSLSDCEHNGPVPGAELKLCSQRDVTCGAPVETAYTDCDGYVTFKGAYKGFEGYALVMPPRKTSADGGTGAFPERTVQCFRERAAKEAAEGKSGDRCAIRLDTNGDPIVPIPDDLVPGVVAIIPPPSANADPNAVIDERIAPHLMSSGTLRSLLGIVSKPFDPAAGHVGGLAVDCQGNPAPGVSIAVSGGIGPNTQLYYTDSQALPNVNQGETAERGETGYLNLDGRVGRLQRRLGDRDAQGDRRADRRLRRARPDRLPHLPPDVSAAELRRAHHVFRRSRRLSSPREARPGRDGARLRRVVGAATRLHEAAGPQDPEGGHRR